MEILTTEIKAITNINELENICNLLYNYHNEFKKIMEETNNEYKETEKIYNLKFMHELYNKKHYEYYKKLGLNHLNLTDNENNENLYNVYDLIEIMENEKITILYELGSFYYYGLSFDYFRENNFKINLTETNYIILDIENKLIYNLNSDNIDNILIRLLKDYELTENTKLNLYNKLNESYFNMIIENTKENIKLYNIDLFNFVYGYSTTDKYIVLNGFKDNYNTLNDIDIDLDIVLNEILNENMEIIEILLNN